MKNMILLALTFTTLQAQADIYTCQFGNPFSSVTYDSSEKKLSTTTILGHTTDVRVFTDVSMKPLESGETALVLNDETLLISMKRTNAGSDGNTNFIYPFSAKANIDENNTGDGACETDTLRAEKPESNEIDEKI